jgi:hypothetical protein
LQQDRRTLGCVRRYTLRRALRIRWGEAEDDGHVRFGDEAPGATTPRPPWADRPEERLPFASMRSPGRPSRNALYRRGRTA